jgi:hypothetical protein
MFAMLDDRACEELTVAMRGYDRDQVRSLFARIRTGALPAELAWEELRSLDTVWRGYDRHQVRFAVRFLLATWESNRPPLIPTFDLVIRGHDPEQVDDLFQALRAGERTASEALAALDEFDDVVQGYEKSEVRFTLVELGARSDENGVGS